MTIHVSQISDYSIAWVVNSRGFAVVLYSGDSVEQAIERLEMIEQD